MSAWSVSGCFSMDMSGCCVQVNADGQAGMTFDTGLGPGVSSAEAALPMELQIRTESAVHSLLLPETLRLLADGLSWYWED